MTRCTVIIWGEISDASITELEALDNPQHHIFSVINRGASPVVESSTKIQFLNVPDLSVERVYKAVLDHGLPFMNLSRRLYFSDIVSELLNLGQVGNVLDQLILCENILFVRSDAWDSGLVAYAEGRSHGHAELLRADDLIENRFMIFSRSAFVDFIDALNANIIEFMATNMQGREDRLFPEAILFDYMTHRFPDMIMQPIEFSTLPPVIDPRAFSLAKYTQEFSRYVSRSIRFCKSVVLPPISDEALALCKDIGVIAFVARNMNIDPLPHTDHFNLRSALVTSLSSLKVPVRFQSHDHLFTLQE